MSPFLDASTVEDGQIIHADVCIVGAGAAGITLARYLEGSGLDVLMLESGGLELEAATQSLFRGKQEGIKYFDLTACRLRYLGGTSNHWAGYCRMHDPVDMQGRTDLDVPAWPVGHSELSPYVKQAAHDLGFEMQGFDPNYQAKRYDIDPATLPDRSSPDLVTKVYQITTRKQQGLVWRQQLLKQAKLRLMLHANVTRINLDAAGQRVESVSVKALGKSGFQVKARWFVMAAHGIENARLLLASDDVIPTGIGNQSDKVGRYFMDHPLVTSGRFFPTRKFQKIYDAYLLKADNLNINLGLSASALKRENIMEYFCRFHEVDSSEIYVDAREKIKKGFWQPADMDSLKAVGTLVGDVPGTLYYAATRLKLAKPRVVAYDLNHRIEQSPNPDSRVRLDTEHDALGVRKVMLDWRFRDLDYRTFEVGQSIIVKELTRLGYGTFKTPALTPDLIRGLVIGNNHHVGTTRMSASPRDGVVDPNLRVHGVQNLFATGSGVFPSAGYGGPTMILMGLTIRLAEHIKALSKAT
jgi:choline dehydrogenase-like flavoprotein